MFKNKFLTLKNSLLTLAAIGMIFAGASMYTPVEAALNDPTPKTFTALVDQGFNATLTVQALSEGVNDSGLYTVNYRFTSPSGQTVSFPLQGMLHKCAEGNGQNIGSYTGVCVDLNVVRDLKQVSLNAGNNFTQDVTFTIQQDPAVKCGSFQSDIYSSFELNFITGSILTTGITCLTPSPSPSPSPVVSPSPSPSVVPSPSVIPSPSPSVTPTPTPTPLNTVQCPVDHIAKIVDSTVVCVAQNQSQEQTQNNNQQQNNNNNQDLNVTVNPEITNTNNNNVTINSPAASVQTVQVAGVSVVNQTPTSVKELPKTGLPLAAVGIASMLPIGSRLRKLGKKNTEESANSAWMKKQLGQ